MPYNPIQEVPVGTALKVSLDNYYDLLKAQIGNLSSGEFLQLKLVADTVDISEDKYKWFSYYNLLRRSDQAIEPLPISGNITTAASDLASVYAKFLRKLRGYVIMATLSEEDQKKLAALDLELDRARTQIRQYSIEDRTNWKEHAELMGYSVGDMVAYQQWAVYNGHQSEIETLMSRIRDLTFTKKTILDRQYPEPTDREVVEAEFDFDNPTMRIRYPIHPDSEYPNGSSFTVTYLASLPLGSSGQFDDRRVITWDKTLPFMKGNTAGSFTARFDNSTAESKSIETDWKTSASARYRFVRVKASASEHTQISEDFKRVTAVELSAAAAYKVAILYPKWFRPSLFEHKRVRENIQDFAEFFGEKGALLYHPTHLVFVRGFKSKFKSSQNWTFDYQKKFSASGGGGFNVFGIGFGGSGSYTSDTKEHKVASSNTELTIEDDANTIRFVGYVLSKNGVSEKSILENLHAMFDPEFMGFWTGEVG